jgi:hypothetical protein
VLERHLTRSYRIVAGNFEEDEFLLQGQNRQLKPDIIIYKNGKPVAILDAKFRNTNTLVVSMAEIFRGKISTR